MMKKNFENSPEWMQNLSPQVKVLKGLGGTGGLNEATVHL